LKLRDLAEHTVVQLKERLTRDCRQDVAEEMVCMSNGRGGLIVVGINDKTGVVNPLSFVELQETNAVLSAMASDNVVPGISIVTENVEVKGGAVVVVTVQRGQNIPYRDNKGVVWVKNAGDKRRVTDNDEIAGMMVEGGSFRPDMVAVKESGFGDLDEEMLKRYLLNRFASACKQMGLDGESAREMSADDLALRLLGSMKCEQLLKNVGLIREDGHLTVAGLMLLGKFPQRWLPSFTVRCVSFVGNSQSGTLFRDKSDASADGNLLHMYRYVMSFLQRNLRSVQKGTDFNTQGELEIPEGALTEVVANALIHRSYVKKAPVRVFVFDNRVEIHSPGLLPDGMDVEALRFGVSRPVNEMIFNHAIHLLPYTGVGTGIMRALNLESGMTMVNDEKLEEFVVIFAREVNEGENDRDDRDNALRDRELTGVEDKENDRVDDRVERVPYRQLTGDQKDIIQYCSIPRSAREILSHIHYSYHPTNIATFIRPLLNMGYLEMMVPDKPNSKNQKYRKVEK